LVVGLFLTIVLAAIMWQKYREAQRREAAAENLRKLGDAINKYNQRKVDEKVGMRVTVRDRLNQELGSSTDAAETEFNDAE